MLDIHTEKYKLEFLPHSTHKHSFEVGHRFNANGRTTQLLEEDRVFSEALTQQAWSAQILHIPKLFGPLRDNWEITQT